MTARPTGGAQMTNHRVCKDGGTNAANGNRTSAALVAWRRSLGIESGTWNPGVIATIRSNRAAEDGDADDHQMHLLQADEVKADHSRTDHEARSAANKQTKDKLKRPSKPIGARF